MQTRFENDPLQGNVSRERVAIIVMAIDVSNFTNSDGLGVDILI